LASALIAAATVELAATPTARAAPPWSAPGDVPVDDRARSVQILEHDEPIFVAPDAGSNRRGAAARGAHLPIYATARGDGCRARWVLVGPSAWVCGDRAATSSVPALSANARIPRTRSGLPLDYHFVGKDGSFGYDHLAQVDVGIPDAELQPGFAVAISEVADHYGEPFGLTTKGIWLPMRDLRPVQAPPLEGIPIRDGNLDLGWTYADETRLYPSPGQPRIRRETLPRWTLLTIHERESRRGIEWLRVADNRWLRANDVRTPSPQTRPAGTLPHERWIDVDLAAQVIVAYEGDVPVYATLASTGRGEAGSPRATPIGSHRIWVKLTTTDMTNLEDAEASRYYAIEEVPWVMFFDRGYGLHGAFWHRSFGRVRSHGCVNLAPRDARWFFDWASPRLPPGWRAVLPTAYDRGTLVRVH
jgi:hypothetical protein